MFFVFRCVVIVVENFFYYVLYFCCWYVSVQVFDIKGAEFCVFIYVDPAGLKHVARIHHK
jgi:hypothetical protein